MKRQMNEALREENQRLEEKVTELEKQEAFLTECISTSGTLHVRALVQAVQALARAVPNTAAGVAAMNKARCALDEYGVPIPTALKKVPKARRRKKSSRRPKTP